MSAEAQAGDSAQTAGDARIDVGDLSFSLSNADLEKIKEKIGNVLQAQVILRGDKHLGYGDLKLRSPEESPADGAFDGILKVVKPRNAKKGRGAATRARGGKRGGRARRSADDPASGEEATNDEAAGQNGIVKTVTDGVAAVTDGISKLVSGESAATTEGGEKAARGGKAGKGRGGKAKAPRPKKERGEPSKTLVFIRNLPFSLTEEGLGSLFKENNLTYSSLSMPTWRFGPRKGKGRGYAFATVASEEEQTKAIETLNGKEMATGEMIKPAPAADGTPAAEDAVPVERKLKLVARQGYENEDKTVEQEHEAEGAAAETPGTNGTA